MICDQSSKFERLFTKSLKKALDLPLHLPNDVLLRIAGVPSLLQIAEHHFLNITVTIQNRFGRSPSSLRDLAASLMHTAEEYQALSNPEPIRALTGNSFVVDLLGQGKGIKRDLLGLATGIFLSLRCSKDSEGTIGHLRKCPTCKVFASQEHFLNDCPLNN